MVYVHIHNMMHCFTIQIDIVYYKLRTSYKTKSKSKACNTFSWSARFELVTRCLAVEEHLKALTHHQKRHVLVLPPETLPTEVTCNLQYSPRIRACNNECACVHIHKLVLYELVYDAGTGTSTVRVSVHCRRLVSLVWLWPTINNFNTLMSDVWNRRSVTFFVFSATST